MFEVHSLVPRLLHLLKVLTRHGRRFAAFMAIAAIIPFGVAPALAQTTRTETQPAATASGPGPLNVATSSVSSVGPRQDVGQ